MDCHSSQRESSRQTYSKKNKSSIFFQWNKSKRKDVSLETSQNCIKRLLVNTTEVFYFVQNVAFTHYMEPVTHGFVYILWQPNEDRQHALTRMCRHTSKLEVYHLSLEPSSFWCGWAQLLAASRLCAPVDSGGQAAHSVCSVLSLSGPTGQASLVLVLQPLCWRVSKGGDHSCSCWPCSTMYTLCNWKREWECDFATQKSTLLRCWRLRFKALHQ